MMLRDALGTRPLVADGAMGTQLQLAGLPIGHGSERWNLDHPDAVEAIHRAYVAAGCDIVLTNSFGAHHWALAAAGLADRLADVNRVSAEIARRAAGPARFVLGDIGPCGQMFEPLGTLSPGALRDDVAQRVDALLAAGVDGIICETMTDIDEAAICVEAAVRAGAPLVIASMAFDLTPRGAYRTMMGVTPADAAVRLRDAGASVVGANCGVRLAVTDFVPLAAHLRDASGLPVMIQPNAGQPVLEDGRAVYGLGPDAFAREMLAVVEAGAAIVGGCCGTSPAHLAALCALIRGR